MRLKSYKNMSNCGASGELFKIGESLAEVLVKSRSQICQNLVMQVKKIWICQNEEVIASFKSFNDQPSFISANGGSK